MNEIEEKELDKKDLEASLKSVIRKDMMAEPTFELAIFYFGEKYGKTFVEPYLKRKVEAEEKSERR